MTDTISHQPSSNLGRMIKTLFALGHLWVGVIIGIPAALLGFSGIWLIVVHPTPTIVTKDSVATVSSIDAIVAAAVAAAPEGAKPQQFDAAAPGKPVTVRFAVPRTPENQRGILRVQIDPATLAVVPNEAPDGGIERMMHDLHGNFLMGREGRPWVGWAGVFMCLLCVSGVVLWWPRRGKWAAAFKFTGKGSTLMVLRELHGAAGIWGLIVFFIISFTGVLISFPPGGAPGGGPGGGREGRGPESALTYKADAAAALAVADRPEFLLRSVALPKAPDDVYKVTLVNIGVDRAIPPTTVTVDSEATKVVSVKNTAEEARNWARPVHTGYTMGWIWWILTLLSGFLPILFAVSGIWMWLIKRRNKARVAQMAHQGGQ
jgi:uncharacterized iron-regulated membrane protein